MQNTKYKSSQLTPRNSKRRLPSDMNSFEDNKFFTMATATATAAVVSSSKCAMMDRSQVQCTGWYWILDGRVYILYSIFFRGGREVSIYSNVSIQCQCVNTQYSVYKASDTKKNQMTNIKSMPQSIN